MNFIDLFCGIGGFRIAFELAGGKCVFSSDIDKYACETYQSNFSDYPLSDITKINENNFPNFDVLCAGFPCQPFSIGGLRKGFHDTRGTLFFDIERIIRHNKPKAFILENVKGLVNHDGGKTLKTILNKLGKKINGESNIEKFEDCLDYFNFEFPKPNMKSTNLMDIIDQNIRNNSISPTLKGNIDFHLKSHQKYHEIKDLKYLLAYEVRKSRSTFRFDNLSPTLTAKMGTGGNNVPIIVNLQRKLTTDECLKIQGYPDDYKIKFNNSQSYKQIGNSVSVPVVTALAKEITKFI